MQCRGARGVVATGIFFVDKLCGGGAVIGGFTQLIDSDIRESLSSLPEGSTIVGCACYDRPFYQVFSADELLAVISACESGSLVILVLDFMLVHLLNDAVCRALRVEALSNKLAVLVLSTSLTWPDEVEGRVRVDKQKRSAVETSLYPQLFR